MSVCRQVGVDGYPCTICGAAIRKGRAWSFRHPEKEPMALLTCCGNCKRLIIESAEGEREV